MGAAGHTQQIGFSVKGLALAEAVGRKGGLQDYRADARGVFVFRYAPLSELPPRNNLNGLKRVMAIVRRFLWSTEPGRCEFCVLDAAFPVKDKDVVYVSNAPMAEAVRKFLSFVFSPVVAGCEQY